jgi:hypothetical protein
MINIDNLNRSQKDKFGIFDSIQETYDFIKSNPSNQKGKSSINVIAHYMDVLYNYACECETITEFGINQVNSTWAFLLSDPKRLTSIDIDLHKNPTKHLGPFKGTNIWLLNAQRLASKSNIEFNVIESDTTKIEIDTTDLLFIDSDHTYKCLSQELTLHGNKVQKYIIFHDTVLFKDLDKAITEFLEANPNWVIKEKISSSPGLTIIKNLHNTN